MGLMGDDDFKISMDDIKDMVSELYGEKIEKVEVSKARSVLREFTEVFLTKGIDEVTTEKLTREEEGLLKQYEQEHAAQARAPEPGTQPLPEISVDVEALKRRVEEETRKKLETEMREKIKQEFTDEKQKKKEEILKKIEQSKQQSAAEAASAAAAGFTTNYSEKMNLINMFEQTQKMLALLLSKLMRRNPVDTMFLKTLEKAMEKYPDVLKKVDCNQYGKVRADGSIEVARLAANLNAMYMPDDRKTEKFLNALKDIFEERLIAVELALGIETKDEILSNLLMQAEKVFSKKEYRQKLKDLFNDRIIPDTTLKPGG